MDTEEMYQRGVADAERGELHPFYYQHYFHYRRGYDRTRRQLRRPRIDGGGLRRSQLVMAILLLLVIGSGAFMVFRARSQPSAAPATALTVPTARPAATAIVRTPIFPTITPSPSPVVGLAIGGNALIANTGGRPLRGRQDPGLNSPVLATFKEGEQVTIQEGPIEADGYTWWRIEGASGAGWSAERSTEGVVWIQPSNS